MFELKGIVPPVVTPLNADETVDEAGLERQIGRLLDGGVHGFFLLGSTGEQPALRDAERVKAIRRAKAVVRGRVPIVVGTMAPSTARAIDHIREAEAEGADAVAVTPPYYFPSRGEDEQLAHYRACAAACGIPLVMYNIPSTTKVMVAPGTMAKLAEVPNIVGVKDSSGDMAHFLRILGLLGGRPGFSVLMGLPPLAASALLAGASGCVPGSSNVDPRTLVRLYDTARAGNLAALPALQQRIHRLADLVAFGAPIVCFKTALELMGVCQRHACAPLQPVDDVSRQKIGSILKELGLL